MEVILLERVAKLGQMGETVRVRDGYARNFLLARGKALRATEGNKKHFESQRAQIEARNLEAKKEAESVAEKLDGLLHDPTTDPRLNRTFVPVGCQHCADPPCMHVCPSTATRQRADGIVTIDAHGLMQPLRGCLVFPAVFLGVDRHSVLRLVWILLFRALPLLRVRFVIVILPPTLLARGGGAVQAGPAFAEEGVIVGHAFVTSTPSISSI